MALNIKDPETDRLVRALVDATGESITEAVATAVRERLDRVAGRRSAPDLVAAIADIATRCSKLPVLDARTADEIVGYGDSGEPV